MNTVPQGRAPTPATGILKITRNHVFAAIFVVFSTAMAIYTLMTLDIGTPDRMGPGFFPLMLSSLLGILSAMVGFAKPDQDTEPVIMLPVRSFLLIIAAPLVFAATVTFLGLWLSVFVTVFVVSFASKFAHLKNSLFLAGGFSVFCVIVFHYFLHLPIPLWVTF